MMSTAPDEAMPCAISTGLNSRAWSHSWQQHESRPRSAYIPNVIAAMGAGLSVGCHNAGDLLLQAVREGDEEAVLLVSKSIRLATVKNLPVWSGCILLFSRASAASVDLARGLHGDRHVRNARKRQRACLK